MRAGTAFRRWLQARDRGAGQTPDEVIADLRAGGSAAAVILRTWIEESGLCVGGAAPKSAVSPDTARDQALAYFVYKVGVAPAQIAATRSEDVGGALFRGGVWQIRAVGRDRWKARRQILDEEAVRHFQALVAAARSDPRLRPGGRLFPWTPREIRYWAIRELNKSAPSASAPSVA